MGLEQLKVREIVQRAVSKNLDIPEFQREFVWDPEQVKFLIDSLYCNYPIGSFLLWDSSEYQEAKTAQGTQASLWIVDGQQRTTALCLLLGIKPYWWPDSQDWNEALERYDVMVNLLPEREDERLEFALPNPIRRRDPRWIGVRQILRIEEVEKLTPLAQEIVNQITNVPEEKMALFVKIHSHLQRIWQIREIDVPIVKINHEIEDVAVIFARLNQAGTRVKEADVILALAAVKNPGWIREKYLPFRNDLEDRGWDLDAGIFVRTITSIGCGRARLIEVPKDFWNEDNLSKIWEQVKETIEEVRKRLAEFGIFSAELLPSTNSLIPLFTLHYCWGNRSGYRFEKALYWFLLANRDGRYSGSAVTSLNEDVRAITEAAGFDEALENLLKRLRVAEIKEEEFAKNRYDRAGTRFLRLMLYLVLFTREVRDWVDGTRIGYDKTGAPINTGFEPQWHHIYPRNMLKKANKSDDEVHSLANITVLNERTNVNKLAGKEPWRYIRQFDLSSAGLRAHLVPEAFIEKLDDDEFMKKKWSVDNYQDFLKERAQLLAHEANRFLDRLKS